MKLLGTTSQSSIPRVRHIILHIDNEQIGLSLNCSNDLSQNTLTRYVECAASDDDVEVVPFHSVSLDHFDWTERAPRLAQRVSDNVVLHSWACGTHPMVWVAPHSEQELNNALMTIDALRKEFSEDALDITLLAETKRDSRNRYMEPNWLQKAWVRLGYFAYCGTQDAVAIVLRHGTQTGGALERPMARLQGQRRPWAVKETRRPDIAWYGRGRHHPFIKYKTEQVDTIRFYDRNKPWYELTNFFQGASFFWKPTSEVFNTVEHFFQAMKTTDPTERVKIAQAPSAREAFNIARNSIAMAWYWEEQCRCGDLYKERVMFMALMQKFSAANPQLRNLLLSTGTCQLNEASRVDSYWGSGDDGGGKNRLGFLLEKARTAILREEFRRRGYGCFESNFQERWL